MQLYVTYEVEDLIIILKLKIRIRITCAPIEHGIGLKIIGFLKYL